MFVRSNKILTRIRGFTVKMEKQFSKIAAGHVVSLKESERFMVDCMVSVDTPVSHAEQLAELLVAADYRGHYSHGINRLEMYVNDVKQGICDAKATPVILKESVATAWVDGRNGIGPVIGKFSMDLAVKKAKESGVGWVCVKGSNHYGIAGWYSMRALESGFLGMSFTNTSPLMSPTRSKGNALGTNPLSLAAPGQNGDSFVLDMATTAVALGKIEVQRRKGEPIPDGWAQDETGKSTNDADAAYRTQCLMPLGGGEDTSGYKGYGLAMLVETFCGILSGAMFGPNVRRWMNTDRIANIGQCFIAIDPNCFAPGFEGRLSELMRFLRNMEPADPDKPVLVPGDPERIHMDEVEKQGGVTYHENQIKACVELANKLKVAPMISKPL